jgi:hypothetical protein
MPEDVNVVRMVNPVGFVIVPACGVAGHELPVRAGTGGLDLPDSRFAGADWDGCEDGRLDFGRQVSKQAKHPARGVRGERGMALRAIRSGAGCAAKQKPKGVFQAQVTAPTLGGRSVSGHRETTLNP